jgi:hypothetical protein
MALNKVTEWKDGVEFEGSVFERTSGKKFVSLLLDQLTCRMEAHPMNNLQTFNLFIKGMKLLLNEPVPIPVLQIQCHADEAADLLSPSPRGLKRQAPSDDENFQPKYKPRRTNSRSISEELKFWGGGHTDVESEHESTEIETVSKVGTDETDSESKRTLAQVTQHGNKVAYQQDRQAMEDLNGSRRRDHLVRRVHPSHSRNVVTPTRPLNRALVIRATGPSSVEHKNASFLLKNIDRGGRRRRQFGGDNVLASPTPPEKFGDVFTI